MYNSHMSLDAVACLKNTRSPDRARSLAPALGSGKPLPFVLRGHNITLLPARREDYYGWSEAHGVNLRAALDAAAHDHSGLPGRVRAAVDRYVLAQSAHTGARVSYRYGGCTAHAVDLLHWP